MNKNKNCIINRRTLFVCFQIAVSISLYGCLHNNEFQVIGTDTAAFPFDQELDYYAATTGEDVKMELSGDEYAGLVTPSEISMLEQIDSIPDLNTPLQLEVVGHCYKLRSGDVEKENKDVEFYAFHHLGDNYFLSSQSDDGCFESGVRASHIITLISIKDSEAFTVGVEGIPLADLEDKFEGWAHEKNFMFKWWHGISSETNMVNNYKGELVEELNVTVEDVSAYESFVETIRDDFYIDSLLFTHKNIEQGSWVQALVSRVEQAQQAREELKNTVVQ